MGIDKVLDNVWDKGPAQAQLRLIPQGNPSLPVHPRHQLQAALAALPKAYAARMEPHHFAQTLGVRVKSRVAQKATDGSRNESFMFADVQEDQAVLAMDESLIPEILVAGEQSWAFQSMENRNNVFVGSADLGDVRPDSADSDAPLTQAPDFDF
jgi:hypothetical protein